MGGMFTNTEFNQNIASWDTSAGTNMGGMFSDLGEFNQNIGMWDTSAVNDMSSIFQYASVFNQNISSWRVTNIKPEPINFASASSLLIQAPINQSGLPFQLSR